MTLSQRLKLKVRQLDDIAGEVNVWLLVMAIGLATLDLAVLGTLSVQLPAPLIDNASAAVVDNAAPPGGIMPGLLGDGR